MSNDRYERIRKALAMGPTPGPWSVRYDYVVQAPAYDDGRLVPVAQPYGVNSDGTDLFANARLIAAAPELLEALKKAVNRQGFTNTELITARAAIAKAEGNS